MRTSQLLLRTLRDTPSEADNQAHALLLRAGYVRPVGSGLYSFTTLGLRVKQRIERILREEMERLAASEVSMPLVQPAELWRESGRWHSVGDEMVRLTDRSGREMCLAMTHEEAATHLVRDMVDSYRQLPVAIYQLQTKFRDEPRARGGLLRVREFTMKDAYSFHAAQDDLDEFYQRMYRAYETVFERCGLEVIAVESDQGMMGGSGAHEFMALMTVGEDTIIICDACGYRANRQVARSRQSEGLSEQPVNVREVVTAKASPVGDDFVAAAGDDCIHCGESLRAERGVEVGNIFKLGTRYSERMNAGFLDDRGVWQPFIMGSYGIGPGRLMACIAQAHHDEQGLVWPRAVAPFDAVIVSLASQKAPEVAGLAQELYDELVGSGISVLLDDRDVRAGVKFADADLIGVPVRITVGARGVADGHLELKWRETQEEVRVPAAEVSRLLRNE